MTTETVATQPKSHARAWTIGVLVAIILAVVAAIGGVAWHKHQQVKLSECEFSLAMDGYSPVESEALCKSGAVS